MRNEWFKSGFEKGMREANKLSEHWRKEGAEQATQQIVKKMLQEQLPLDVISRVTGVPVHSLESIS